MALTSRLSLLLCWLQALDEVVMEGGVRRSSRVQLPGGLQDTGMHIITIKRDGTVLNGRDLHVRGLDDA